MRREQVLTAIEGNNRVRAAKRISSLPSALTGFCSRRCIRFQRWEGLADRRRIELVENAFQGTNARR